MRVMPRPSLSYANVMSTIAVFLALGGGAWAVTGQTGQKPLTVTACVKKAGKAKEVVPFAVELRGGDPVISERLRA
jgi:hypothetical protein